jgi:hypothetical protein
MYVKGIYCHSIQKQQNRKIKGQKCNLNDFYSVLCLILIIFKTKTIKLCMGNF